ncbi:transposase [Streptomyces sp. NPDC001231]|uniref:IS110 family transposase n=1 Tax=Streptomyces sp. NPDC001231 TaxID=3364549 RepID=UPI00368B728B
MVVFGIDAHKRNHTAVAVDDRGRKLGERTTGTTSGDHLRLLTWAQRWGGDRLWAIEDCRQLSRRLERDLLAAGERIVRVPPKLMANCRSSARTYGKSDPIDALAVARAALREPDLPTASLDGDTGSTSAPGRPARRTRRCRSPAWQGRRSAWWAWSHRPRRWTSWREPAHRRRP